MLRHETHGTPELVTAEFQHIDKTKQSTITLANRAPIEKDKGQFWYDWSNNKFYGRNQNTGTWQAV